jgi:hypothetical protein
MGIGKNREEVSSSAKGNKQGLRMHFSLDKHLQSKVSKGMKGKISQKIVERRDKKL